MGTLHGTGLTGLELPHGDEVPVGRFGRMFPLLPPRRPTGLPLAEQYGLPGGKLDGGQTTTADENPSIPAGFTYLGQFIDHNITFDPLSALGQRAKLGALVDFRPPRLDLANLYGSGPTVQPYLYDPDSDATKLTLAADGVDLGRTAAGTALIGDPRNDENMLLSQLHLAMIKFHNAIVDGLRGQTITDVFGHLLPPKPPNEPPTEQPGVPLSMLLDVDNYYDRVLASAQQLASWHYQWIIVHEFLPLVGDPVVVEDVERNGPRFFQPGTHPFMPVEFSAAGFRALGHPSVRSSYQVNANFAGKIFPDNPDAPTTPRTDLRGGPVSAADAVDFSFFFPTDPARQPQHAKKFNAKLNSQLLDLPISAVPGGKEGALARPVASLAVRNLLRSEVLGLPSGQDVARKVGVEPLTDEQLESTGPIYLWYYLLKEAELLGSETRLGPVGTRIVAETLIGLLNADPGSYRAAYPHWQPTLGVYGRFGIVDLLKVAGVARA
jgi:Animal haem peroxidase